jgi:Leucine-rich repeat (LRR) protein
LCNCNIGPDGAIEIARCLESNRSLTLLCLQSNQISDIGAKKILAAILEPPHPTLNFLNLSNNQLTDVALEGLGRFHRLVDVVLNNNNISDRGILDICKAVLDTTSLTYLNLRDNPQITPRGVQTLKLFLPDPFALDF